MTNLVPYNNDGFELVVDTTTGESFASIKAVARMTDKDTKSISRYVNGGLKGVAKMTLKMAEIQTAGGLQGVALLNEDQMIEVITKYKPELLAKFAKISLRQFLHQLIGYKHKSFDENPNQGLWNEICKSANYRSYHSERRIRGEGTHGEYATNKALNDIKELNATYNDTMRESMFRAGLRLELEPPDSMIGEECAGMIVKQFRQTQIHREGVDSVPEHMLTKKELRDKKQALKNNPSSKEHLLEERKERKRIDNSKADLSTLKNPPREKPPLIQGISNQTTPALPQGFTIDIDGVYIEG